MTVLNLMSAAATIAVTGVALSLASTAAAHKFDDSNFDPADIIVRDVAVVGGGATGSYAAVRIKDAGKSVVVVELASQLGGHADTYTDPFTGAAIDYGVLAYMDLPGSKDFFARFGIPTIPVVPPPFVNQYIDLKTGKPVPGYPSHDAAAQATALGLYAQLAAQYNDLIFPGYFGLASAPAVPDELLLPFGEFVAKYGLEAAVPTIWTFVSGLGDVLATPTLFVLQNFGAVHIAQLTSGGFFRTANNSALYAAVATHLGPEDVLFRSRVANAERTDAGVRLLVKDAGGSGRQKLIKAKKLLVTIPPTKDAMWHFEADATENDVWSRWTWNTIHAGVFSGSNLPLGLNIINTNPSATALNLPLPPFVDPLAFTGVPGLYRTMVVGPATGFGLNDAKQLVREAVRNIGTAGTFPDFKRIDFAAWEDHSPSQLRVSSADLAAGFFGRLYALQGRRSTWYTGAPWSSDYSSILWLFTEVGVLPGLLAGL